MEEPVREPLLTSKDGGFLGADEGGPGLAVTGQEGDSGPGMDVYMQLTSQVAPGVSSRMGFLSSEWLCRLQKALNLVAAPS